MNNGIKFLNIEWRYDIPSQIFKTIFDYMPQSFFRPQSRPPTPDQNVYHARTQAWKTPPFRGFWTKNIPFSSEIADFEVQ